VAGKGLRLYSILLDQFFLGVHGRWVYLNGTILAIPVNRGWLHMDRGEKVRRVQELDGKVFRVYNVKVEKHYLHPDYELIAHDPAVLSETGRLGVFEVKSISGTRPNFSGRWDGGDRNKPEKIRYDLDIDILEVARKIQRQFKNGENGYSGHHTTPSARVNGLV
jgi:hypothetical protein